MRVFVVTALVLCIAGVHAADVGKSQSHWVASWTASVHGPFPVGNPSAQPNLSLAFPSPETGARDQSLRMIVRPDVFGPKARIRLSNALGTAPVIFDGVNIGLQLSGAEIVRGTNRAVTFGGKPAVTIPPGESVWSDAVALPFVKKNSAAALAGRKLAVSFHVAGESGRMTWHAKALQTSYLTAPGAGAQGKVESEAPFKFSTTSWYFLDALDMQMGRDTSAIVAFGDSITDGTASTLNGDDRWPDVLSRRLHATYGERLSIVNAGIGGNQVVGPAEYTPQKPFPGGPAAGQRLERDVLSLSGVSTVIWLEGINDFSKNGNATLEAVQAGMREIVGRIRARIPGVKVIGATVTSAFGSSSAAHGFAEQDEKRKALNEFIRASGLFDGVVDFDRATLDPQTGGMRAEFLPESTTGGAGDKLHPNRLGYAAMGAAIDLGMLAPKRK
ncbi:MAG: tesA [Betaproteobacteria bacterium]|nr:tesA [Betaproteobacteria bacterium]